MSERSAEQEFPEIAPHLCGFRDGLGGCWHPSHGTVEVELESFKYVVDCATGEFGTRPAGAQHAPMAESDVADQAAVIDLDTVLALALIAFGRAPRQMYGNGKPSDINRRIVCADGFKVSVQASSMHYCDDSSGSKEAYYWRFDRNNGPVYPFTAVEVGNPSGELPVVDPWSEDGGGIWAFVPIVDVAHLLDLHGGAVSWEVPSK